MQWFRLLNGIEVGGMEFGFLAHDRSVLGVGIGERQVSWGACQCLLGGQLRNTSLSIAKERLD